MLLLLDVRRKEQNIKEMTKINGGLNNGGNTIKRTEF